MDALEFDVDGTCYVCYRTGTRGGENLIDTYVVAGAGSITIARDSGEIVSVAAVTLAGADLLKRLAPLIHRRESGKYRI